MCILVTKSTLNLSFRLFMCIRIDVTTVTERALHWRTNRMIDDEYHNCIASNLHLRVQIKNELCEMSVRLMMKGI